MLEKLQLHLNTNFPFLKGKHLFLAVSGGMDSMILLQLFHQLKYEIAVLHCNFSLRNEESDGDEYFVKQYCEEKQIPLFIQKFDTKQFAEDAKVSIQIAARKLRYDWFYEQLADKNFDYILTAHHLDDSLETFLINFTRGSGMEGFTGIPQQNDKIVRPLLVFSRNDIEVFAQDNNVEWREDSSNATDKYWRNKLRHDVIPVLKALNPSLLSSFENTVLHLKQTQSLRESNHLGSLEENGIEQFLSTHSYYSFNLNDPFIIRYEIEYNGKEKSVYVINYNAPIVFLLLQGILG
jgi:tRNA(Ile)-lysidine synthase